jgi:hypothetical protein
MKKFFTLITLFLLMKLPALAQSAGFEKGFVIQQKDTIAGFIQIASDEELSQSIKFKKDPALDSFTEYYPGDISAFGFEGNGFRFATVRVELFNGSTTRQVSRFAKLLLSGYANLYKLQLPKAEQSVILKRNNTFLYILRNDTVDYTLGQYEVMEANSRVRLHKRYVGMLRVAFLDCTTQGDGQEAFDLNKLDFNDKAIMEAVTRYNNCKNPSIHTVTYAYKTPKAIKHGVEVAYTRLLYPRNSSSGPQGQGVSAGYYWDIVQPDVSRKISTRIGLNYLYFNYSYKNQWEKEMSHAIHFFRIPLSGQVNLKDPVKSNFIPFFNAGLTAQVSKSPLGMDYVPFPHMGVGLYNRRIRYALLVENDGLGLANVKLFNFSIGVRLDKQ